MRPKGLREIKTVRGTPGRGRGSSREQAVAELARLEHEKARLQRELDVWEQNRQRTAEHLGRVEARLGELRHLIEGESPAPRPGDRPAPARSDDTDEPPPAWATISLEY